MRSTEECSRPCWQIPATLLIGVCCCLAPVAAQQCDNAPTAADDAVEYRGESAVWVDVMANDGEADGEELEVIVQSSDCGAGSNASVEFGALRLELPLNDTTDCTVSYYLRDESGDTSSTASVQVIDQLIFADFFTTTTSIWSDCVSDGAYCPPQASAPTDQRDERSRPPEAPHRVVETAAAAAL